MSDAIRIADHDDVPDDDAAAVAVAPDGTRARARRQALLAVGAGVVAMSLAIGMVVTTLLRPAPAPTAPPATPAAPTPATPPDQVAVDGLVAAVTAPGRAWRVEAIVELWRDGQRGIVQFSATVSGDDSSGTMAGTLITGDLDWVVKGDRRWQRVDGGTWKGVRGLDPNRGWDPFSRLSDEVEPRFLRWEQKGGQRYAQVLVAGLLVLDPTAYFEAGHTITDVRGAQLILDVDADGRPARGVAEATVSATDSAGTAHEFKLRARYAFADVGAPLEIALPTNS
jgi:hypothetical protein